MNASERSGRAQGLKTGSVLAAAVHPNAALVRRFYAAFGARDAEAMAACYAADVVFRDPAFGELKGARAGDMWRMLTARAKDLQVEATDVTADDATGSARWVATYTFGKTGRRVRNVIDARFRFRDGRIVEHTDTFDMWRWTRMAFGPAGALLGWTPMMQRKVRAEATRGLDAFVAKRTEASP